MKRFFIFLLSFMLLTVNVSAQNVVWFDNLADYLVGNYARITDFKNGYAHVTFAQSDGAWSTSDEIHLIIDKTGRILLGPFFGHSNIMFLDNNKFAVYSWDSKSTIIADAYGNTVATFSGQLFSDFNKEGVAIWASSHYNAKYGLIKSDGTIVVPCKYEDIIANSYISKYEYFLFRNSNDSKNAVVYLDDGTYSHVLNTDYTMGYLPENNLIVIGTQKGEHGLMDIHGNIILEPFYTRIEILSENRIFLTADSGSFLVDNQWNVINTYDRGTMTPEILNRGPILNNFILEQSGKLCLVTETGEIIKTFENEFYDGDEYTCKIADYCGEGIFRLDYYSYPNRDYSRLFNAEIGEFIGEKYAGYTIEFNEGYAVVRDLEYNTFLIDKEGNKCFEEYNVANGVSEGVLPVFDENKKVYGIIHVPKYKATRLVINGNEIKLVSKIRKNNDRTFYPFRECLENMGATVSWDSEKQIATGEYNGIKIEFPIGENEYYINGVKHEMDVKSYIDDSIGRTYIPIRYAAEGLGFAVDWTEGDLENTISIH